MYDTGIIIGLKNKEHKFKSIINKLLKKEQLTHEENDFLRKQQLLF